MLLKLIKYDFKSTYAKMLITFAVFALLCIIVPPIIVPFQRISAFIYLAFAIPLGIMAMLVLTLVFLFQRYNSNLYSNEGYLMFTLPTNGNKLLASKLIVSFVWITAGVILMFGSLGMMAYVLSFQPEVARAMPVLLSRISLNFSTITSFIVEYIVGTVLCMLEIYFAISVSKLPLWHKCGVLMGFVTFFAVNIIVSLPSWIYVNGSQLFRDSVAKNNLSRYSDVIGYINYMISLHTWGNEWVCILTEAVGAAALFVGTSLLLEKKTSLK